MKLSIKTHPFSTNSVDHNRRWQAPPLSTQTPTAVDFKHRIPEPKPKRSPIPLWWLLVALVAFAPPAVGITFEIISSKPNQMRNGIDYYTQSAIHLTDGGGRTGHVSSLWPLTLGGELSHQFVSFYAAAYMAMEHFNNRSGAVVPELPELLKGCDFHMTSDVRDDKMSRHDAVKGLQDALYPTDRAHPFAIFGSLSSGVTEPLSILTDAYQVAQISGTTTSTDLEKSSFFSRTIPTNQGEASALMVYLKSIQVDRMAVLYIQDPYGESFHNTLLQEAQKSNITVALSMPYTDNNDGSIEASMKLLQNSEVKYIFAIITAFNWKPVVHAAHRYGIMGTNTRHQWFMVEYHDVQNDDFSLDAATDSDLADALHGLGIIYLYSKQQDSFNREFEKFILEKEGGGDEGTMLQRFIESHVEPELYNNIELTMLETNMYFYTLYDAMLALGIAACRTPGQFLTKDFYTALLQAEFPGASGWVAFDKTTGTRLAKDLEYRVDNILISPVKSTNTSLRFTHESTASIQDNNITHFDLPFVYPDNTTTPPPSLPPIAHHEYNLIPPSSLALGGTMCGFVMLVSVASMAWTFLNRNNYVVRVGQPIFLCQLCLGTFTMAMAIIPLSMQEKEDGSNGIYTNWDLDAACMATPWLLCTGFVISVSAILAKTMRLNKVISNGREMKRIVVTYRDVLLPLIIMLTCNVVLLLACTIVAPYTWHRIPVDDNFDVYGRSLESYGTCQHVRPSAPDTDMTTYYLMIPIMLVNLSGVCIAVYQCYLARDLPTALSEASYLFVATVSLLEVCFIGGPILFLPQENPTTYYLVLSSMISLASLSILVPLFAPKVAKFYSGDVQQLQRRSNPVDMKKITGNALKGSSEHTARRNIASAHSHVECNSLSCSNRDSLDVGSSHLDGSGQQRGLTIVRHSKTTKKSGSGDFKRG